MSHTDPAATMNRLVQALLDGDQTLSVATALELRASGIDNARIVADGIEGAMAWLNEKCTLQQFNLLEIMLCGRAATAVTKTLFPLDAPMVATRGTVVLAALEGDVHDLGKNIFKMVLTVAGYRVVDCGKDCPLESLVETVGRERPRAVGISGLITTVIPQVRQLKDLLAARGLSDIPLMAGGAALKQTSAASLNVDFVGQNAFDGLQWLNGLGGQVNLSGAHEQP